MKIQTFIGVPRPAVDAILNNVQRCFPVSESDKSEAGQIVRFVSNELSASLRRDVFRVVTHRQIAGAGCDVISLRPLTKEEKAALKTPDSGE